MNINKYYKLAVVFVSIVCSTCVLAIDTLEFARLKSKAAFNGEVTVIVQLSPHDIIRNFSANNLTENGRILANRFAQTQLKQSMGIELKDILHEFKYTPAMQLRVNQQMLDKLSQSLWVEQINEDKWLEASLAESVSLTFPNQSTSEYTGNNEWAVAVLDTGVDKNHSFLKTDGIQKVISEACYSGAGIIDPRVVSFCPGSSFSSTASNSGLNCTGFSGCDHGTHVAGIAAGDGISFDGMARLGKIIAIQVFTGIIDPITCNGPTRCILTATSDLIKGLERVYELRNTYNIAAVNLSLGGGQHFSACPTDPTAPIIGMLKDAGIATIIASGNDSFNNSISSPACVPDAIAVGASIDDGFQVDQRASYSNNSADLDLYAPGSFINSSIPGGGFSVFQGTSMATPHVAGAFSLFRHANADATVDEIEAVLKSVGPLITSSGIARRRLDVQSALELLRPISGDSSLIPMLHLLLFSE